MNASGTGMRWRWLFALAIWPITVFATDFVAISDQSVAAKGVQGYAIIAVAVVTLAIVVFWRRKPN